MEKKKSASLATCPKLLDEWDYEKNNISPYELTVGSNRYVWWKCKEYGHSWETKVQDRTRRVSNCPYCSYRKVLPGFNDLGTTYPEIYNLWDYEKNNGKTPKDFTGRYSAKEFYLKCPKGHSYKTSAARVNTGRGCPVCSNRQVVIGVNDLVTTHPHITKEWDYDKNGELRPEQVTHGSEKSVWWICKHGHSWKSIIYARTEGRGCPECLKETQVSLVEKTFTYYLSKYFDDLVENYHSKELGKRELDIYVPSIKLAIEYDGHNWHKNYKYDLIKDNICKDNGITLIRIREDGCPKYDSSAYFLDAPAIHGDILLLKDTINQLYKLLHELFNIEFAEIESVEQDLSLINESYYSFAKKNSLAVKHPELLNEWDYDMNGKLNPEFIGDGSDNKVWWKCKNNHSWTATVSSRTSGGNGCPYCYGKKVLKGFNDLEFKYPDIAKEWDYEKNGDLKPSDVYYNSNKKVHWKCACNHSWETKISTRTKMKTGCPICAGLKPEIGNNDLATLYPDIAKEWDCEKNYPLKPEDFLPGSEKNVYWICPRGHSYDAQIFIRAKMKCGCPYCSNKRILQGYNDLGTMHPELAKEWDYEKNGDLLPTQVGGAGGSHRRIWWKCVHGHSWNAILSARISQHTGCPKCAIERNQAKKKKNN